MRVVASFHAESCCFMFCCVYIHYVGVCEYGQIFCSTWYTKRTSVMCHKGDPVKFGKL